MEFTIQFINTNETKTFTLTGNTHEERSQSLDQQLGSLYFGDDVGIYDSTNEDAGIVAKLITDHDQLGEYLLCECHG